MNTDTHEKNAKESTNEVEEKKVHVRLEFTISWNIVDFENWIWPSDEELIHSSIEQVVSNYLNSKGLEKARRSMFDSLHPIHATVEIVKD